MVDYYGKQVDSVVYFVFYPQVSVYLKDRLSKCCETFGGETFLVPNGKKRIGEKI